MDGLHLYRRYIATSFRGQMQYRASFAMSALGNFCTYVVRFFAIWIIFARFDTIKGWTLHEVALLYGIIHIACALADFTSPGFRHFGDMVRQGDFDRLLLRPRSTVGQLAAQGVQLSAVGPLLQGIAVLAWAAHNLSLTWTTGKIALLLTSISGGTLLFYGLYVFEASLVFWTSQSLEFMNSITRGGLAAAQYPIAIYKTWLRRLFTFVVPFACVNYYPALYLLKRDEAVGPYGLFLVWGAPAIGLVFFAVCLQFWAVGVRHYRSTGS